MNRKKPLLLALFVVLVLIAAACGPSATPAAEAPTTAPTDAPTDAPPTMAPTDVPPTDEPPTAAAADVFPTPTVEEMPDNTVGQEVVSADIPGRPSEAAPPNEFRSDPGALVGATGNPQLVEFFTFW